MLLHIINTVFVVTTKPGRFTRISFCQTCFENVKMPEFAAFFITFKVYLCIIRLLISSIAPPRFTSKPPSQITIKEGAKLSLNTASSGNPTPKVTWSVRDKNHGNQSQYTITSDQFEIKEVRFEDQGIITCRAENLFGVQETKVELIVFGEFSFIHSDGKLRVFD